MKTNKIALFKIPVVAIMIFVMLVLGFQQGKFFNYSFSESSVPESSRISTIKLEDAKYLFPSAVKVTGDISNVINVFDKNDKIIGYIISSKPYSDSLTGFAGPVHFLIGINTKNHITGIKLTEHSESPGYIDFIEKNGFFDNFKNKPIDSIINDKIDAVTGATMTTSVIIKALKQKAAAYSNTNIKIKNQDLKKK